MSSGLYLSGFTPKGVDKRLDRSSMIISGKGQAAEVLRQHHVPSDWGDPVEAVSFATGSGVIKAIVADYANYRRVILRLRNGAYRVEFTRWDLR